ncbi:MAG: putative ABC transporter ATP-binding protein YxlF [Alphaproteobacteria bacterium MarineAlpha9_Bin3]|nr:MAG: putative ABC transporter ATP-binding protein YxlF [Alphaproteobacteria bacterium MarineAlpha9_Bin3]|tara:strand:+ start:124 stop:867 length:744 start_codon:yes stop_codon:yes gene_type:complete
MSVLIEVDHLTKSFGPFIAVDNISFSLKRGEVLGFLGPNGAGKTTTMRMITGFLSPTEGNINVCGNDVTRYPLQIKEKIGYVPEGAPLYGEMTVLNFLNFIAEVRKIPKKKVDSAIESAIKKLGLELVLYQQLETLSKGYKRRVGLSQAIIHDPDVLILDEPTDGLDPNQKHEVRKLIKEMASTKAIIISTHILEEVDAVCTRAMIISKGKMVVDKSPKELLIGAPKGSNLDDVFRTLTIGDDKVEN